MLTIADYLEWMEPTTLEVCHMKLKHQTINAGENAEKREPSYMRGGNVNWYNHYGNQYGESSKKKKELPYDPEIPLLDIYAEKTIIRKDTCTLMFRAALFTMVKTWKQHNVH